MKKILISIMTMGIVAAMMGAGTFAYFTDTDTAPTNTFTAGNIAIAISGDSIWTGHSGSDIVISDGSAIFNFDGIVPGDTGTADIDCTITGTGDLYIDATETSGNALLASAIGVNVWLDDGTVAGSHDAGDIDIEYGGTLSSFITTATSLKVDTGLTGTHTIIFEWTFTETSGDQSSLMGETYVFGMTFEART